MSNTRVSLGDKVKDKVTGFIGIVTCTSDYLNGCRRIGVQAAAVKGEIKEAMYFDEPQLVVVTAGAVKCGPQITGGPRQDPARRQNPR